MDREVFWNSILNREDTPNLPDREVFWRSILDREDTANLADYLLSPNETNVPPTSLSAGDSPSLNIWNSAEANSNAVSLNQENNVDEMEIGWRMEGENILSRDNVDINRSSTQTNNEQPFQFSFNSNLNDLPQDLEHNLEVSESVLFSNPYVPSSLQHGKGPSSSNSRLNLASNEYDDRAGSSMESRRLACKRKNIERLHGQSSSTTNSSVDINMNESNNVNASLTISGPSSISSTTANGTNQAGNFVRNVGQNVENSSRNFRLWAHPSRQHGVYPHLLSMRSSTQNISSSLADEHSSNLVAFSHRLESRATDVNSRPVNLPQNPILDVNNQAPISRTGSSSNSLNPMDFLTAIREETVARNTRNSRNEFLTHSLIAPENVASSIMDGTMGPTSRERHQNPRSVGEASHRSRLHASIDSETRRNIQNFLMQRSTSSIIEEGGRSSQQGDGGPIPMRLAREGRSRVISEIRNALDLMRRGERLMFEDAFMLDHPLFQGIADMHDRHRDMRLDVDNMSYEELLALEERIGNVSTGLSEEKIMKNLKQLKHIHVKKEAGAETEPCCICQEEYVEDEDLGKLDCSHDFHVACIKQWLKQKNTCPICKTTALIT